MTVRRPRQVSTGTWRGLSAPARADLFASDFLRSGNLDDPSGLEGVEDFFGVSFDSELHPALRAIATKCFLGGAEREAQLESALNAERAIRLRMELLLREHGIAVPTDPHPSDPPDK